MNVPQLRFSGFDGEFKNLQLNDLCQVIDCQHSTAPVQREPSNFKMIRTSNVRNGRLITETMDSVSEETYHAWSIRDYLKKDDVILTREAPMGEVAIVQKEDVKYFLGQRVLQLKSNRSTIIPYYLYLILQSKTFEKYIQPIKAGGSTVSNIRIPELKSMEFQIPTIEEQRRVSSLLKLVNFRLEKQQEKIVKLEQFKKGMMQKIFSQELRFKDEDGGEFSEWEEKDFSVLLESISTKPYQILSSQIVDDGKYEVVDQGKSLIAGYSNNSEKLFNKGSAIVYGDHTTVVKFREEPFVIGADGTKILINIKEENSLKYLYFALSFYNLEPEGYKRHFSILKNIKLPVPEPKEQEKIADYLTKLERKVEKEQEKLMVLEEQKKGFTQKMIL